MAGIPSAADAASTAPSGDTPRNASTIFALSIDTGRVRIAQRHAGEFRQLHLIDLALQLDDAVDERLRARRAAGYEHVDRHNLINSLNEGVVVEYATNRCA